MSAPQWGHVAEWLRSGLQNRLHQFNSGRGLQQNQPLTGAARPDCHRVATGGVANSFSICTAADLRKCRVQDLRSARVSVCEHVPVN